MPTKVLQITAAYKPAYIYGGPTMSVAKLCEALNQVSTIDFNVEVLTTTANGKTELPVVPGAEQKVDGVTVTYFKRITKDHTHFSPALLLNLRKKILLNAGKDQLFVHIHAWWNLVSILSCAMAKWYKIPVVLSPRGMLTSYTLGNRNAGFKAMIQSLLGKKLLPYCHIHATSEKEKEDILNFINVKNITVIPNLVDLPKRVHEKIETKENGTFKLLFISRIEEKKGLELLFEALAGLTIDWTLQIAGDGEPMYLERLKSRVQQLNLTDKIIWLGHIKNEDKFELMKAHDLMVLTSYNENFANVVIESLSMGTPVLLSNQVGLASYVQRHNLGWVSTLDPKNIESMLLKAYNNEITRTQIREMAPDKIERDFNQAILTEQYLTLYQKDVRL